MCHIATSTLKEVKQAADIPQIPSKVELPFQTYGASILRAKNQGMARTKVDPTMIGRCTAAPGLKNILWPILDQLITQYQAATSC